MGAKCRPLSRNVEGWGLLGNGSRSSCGSFAGLLTVFEPVTFAVHFQDMDVMSKPIQQGSGQPFRSECLGPFVERKVAGDQRGAPLVTPAEDLKQQFGAGLDSGTKPSSSMISSRGGEHLLEAHQSPFIRLRSARAPSEPPW